MCCLLVIVEGLAYGGRTNISGGLWCRLYGCKLRLYGRGPEKAQVESQVFACLLAM